MVKRLLALVLCLTLVCCGAQASFLDAYDTLSAAYDAGETLRADLRFTLEDMEASDGGLAALKGMLEPLTLSLSLRGGEQALAILKEDETLFSLAGILSEEEGKIPALRRLFGEGLPILYDTLKEGGKTEEIKRSVSIKNVGSAGLQTVFTYTAEEANAILPTLHELLDPYASVLTAGEPYQEAFLAYLSAMSFSGKLTVKRFKSKDEADMGIQVTARVTDGKDKRSITIFGGYAAGKGAYVSFACPATSGSNQFKTVFSYAVKNTTKQDTFTLTLDTTRRIGKDRYTKALDVSLKSKPDGDERRVTGEAALSKTEGGIKKTWTLKPELTAKAEEISGTCTLTQTTDKLQNWQISVNGTLGKGDAAAFTGAEQALDLRKMNEEEQLKALAPARDRLLTLVAKYISALDEKEQSLLINLFRTDAWMNGPSVPVPKASDEAPAM